MTTHPLVHPILCRVFWWNIKSPRWLSPRKPRFSTLQLLAFPRTKITFEREEFSDHRWASGKYNGVADGDWESCVRSQGAYFEGDWGIIVLWTMFLVSCTFFNKCLYFPYPPGQMLSGQTMIYTYKQFFILTLPTLLHKCCFTHTKCFLSFIN